MGKCFDKLDVETNVLAIHKSHIRKVVNRNPGSEIFACGRLRKCRHFGGFSIINKPAFINRIISPILTDIFQEFVKLRQQTRVAFVETNAQRHIQHIVAQQA